MNFLKSSFILISASMALPIHANTLDDAKSIQDKTNAASAASQKKIDKSSDSAIELQAEIEQLSEQVKNLEVYRNHLRALVDNQKQEMVSLDKQIEEIKDTRQGIVPLMYKMIDGLQSVLEQDKPIRLQARTNRLEQLKSLMPRADVSDAEKFRRILEAYQIEMDYGRKLGSYKGQISLNNNESVDADILYLGRVALIARNPNASQYWTWDQAKKQWQPLESSYKSDLDTAYSLAAKQIAPTLVTLPVSLVNAEAN
ncbi:DUF3450 domain-containing protein [Vibrio sp. Y2-5]|uniref:DUF3450 domain-containing protein n=1 Tax=Vibrio sp. Y2-5 TaxID=2743977 RepID=UPI001660CC40|nr:DUF3450 domain-containing protein [Vibrio sp. Y2-5]MBD0785625.1 DUF3450 domain-containing protein [Vibrio sp. Y2-5]